jgi:hypothetical protein
MRVLITGSRDFPDRSIVTRILNGCLDAFSDSGVIVIHGACNTELDTRNNRTLGIGADAYAHAWCELQISGMENVKELPFPADWKQYGRNAGRIRNQQMIDKGKPDICYGFMNKDGSSGTTNMLNLAASAGIATYRIQCWNV